MADKVPSPMWQALNTLYTDVQQHVDTYGAGTTVVPRCECLAALTSFLAAQAPRMAWKSR